MSVGTEKPQLSVHSSTYSQSEVIINTECFPGVELGDLLSLSWSEGPMGEKQFIRVDSTQRVKKTRQHISVLKSVADAFGLQPWTEVQVSKVDTACAVVEFVEFIFKDHYFSRRDLWRFKKSLFGCSAYIGKVFTWKGVHIRVQDLRSHGQTVRSGVLMVGTNFNFRSQCCGLCWLVQISKEMYEFSPSGQLHYEIFVNSFLRKLLDRWCTKQVRHSFTVVFFSRTFYLHELDPTKAKFSRDCRPICFSNDRKAFEDVAVNTLDPDELSLQLKREMMEYPSRVGWCVPTDVFAERGQKLGKNTEANCVSIGEPSYASNGNFLEAINVTLNILEKHYIDRNLDLSGNSIVAISASPGVFEVDPYLAAITKQRMMDCGIGMDMISLSQPPFHVAPLFTYAPPTDACFAGWHYEVPHWMNLSFASGLDSGSSDLKKVGADELDNSSSYPYFDAVEADSETRSSILYAPLRETEESNGTIDVLSCLPSPLAMLLSPNITRIESPTNSIGAEQESTCETLVQSDQKGGDLPEYSFPSYVLKGQIARPSHQSNKFPILQYTHKGAGGIQNCQVLLADNERSSIVSSQQRLAQSAPQGSRIVQHSISSLQPPTSSSALCRSLTCSWSSSRNILGSGSFRPFQDSNDSIGLPRQPSVPNVVDDGTHSGGMGSRLDSFQHLRACSSQTSTPRKGLSIFAVHDASVFLWPRMNATQLKKTASHSGSIMRSIRAALEPKIASDGSECHSKQSEGRQQSISMSMPATSQPVDTLGSRTPKSHGNGSDSHPTRQHKMIDSLLSMPRYSLASNQLVGSDNTPAASDSSSDVCSYGMERSKRGLWPTLSYDSTAEQLNHYHSTRGKEVENFDDVEVGRLINPFSKHDEEKLLKLRTHNRRRWSHVFPVGEVEFKNIPGPNWNSLCEPSLLPLTTDYLPMFERENYLQSNYSLTVGKGEPFSSGNQYSNERMLMEEMVCQRLAQGFQLVEGNVTTGSSIQDIGGVHGAGWRGRRRGHVKQQQMIAGPAVDGSGSILYTLSMGHHIHCMSYDSISEQVVVKMYLSRFGSNAAPGNKVSYRYSIWSALENKFQTAQQEFYKYPVSEYAWNHLDELMGGWYSEEMTEPMKYMRMSFVIVPPCEAADSMEGEREYIDKMQKLHEYINLRAPENPGPFKFRLHYSKDPEEEVEQLPYSPHSEEEGDTCQVVHIVLSHQSDQSDQEGGENNSSYEWLSLVCDKFVDVKRAFYMEVRWLVCISSNVEEYIRHNLYGRAKALGLNLVQVPYYFVTSSLSICPFITHAFLKLSNQTVRNAVIDKLVHGSASSTEGSSGGLALNFIRGSSLQCDCSGAGMEGARPQHENPTKGGLAESLSGGVGMFRSTKSHKNIHASHLKQRSTSYYHRSALALIRVSPQGLVFQYNYLWPDIKHDEGMSKVRQLLIDLKGLISSMSSLHS